MVEEMSAEKKSIDVQGIKTRKIMFQNPDNTYPIEGSILTMGDNRGHGGWSNTLKSYDITVNNPAQGTNTLRFTTDATGCWIEAGATATPGSSAKLFINNYADRGSPVATFDIAQNRVGINNTAPTCTLDVTGTIKGTTMNMTSGNATTLVVTGSFALANGCTFHIPPEIEPGDDLLINSVYADKVVVGTTDITGPYNATLDVEGTMSITGGMTAASGIFTGGITAASGIFTGGITATTGKFTAGVTTPSLTVDNAISADGITVDSATVTGSMNVGGGITVVSDATARAFFASSGGGMNVGGVGNNNLHVWTNPVGTYIEAGVTTASGSGTKLYISSMNNLTQTATFDTAARRVGIDQTNPQYPLDVAGNAHVSGSVLVDTTIVLKDGTTLAPSLNFGGGPSTEGGGVGMDTDTGIWHPSDGILQIVSNSGPRITTAPGGSTIDGGLTVNSYINMQVGVPRSLVYTFSVGATDIGMLDTNSGQFTAICTDSVMFPQLKSYNVILATVSAPMGSSEGGVWPDAVGKFYMKLTANSAPQESQTYYLMTGGAGTSSSAITTEFGYGMINQQFVLLKGTHYTDNSTQLALNMQNSGNNVVVKCNTNPPGGAPFNTPLNIYITYVGLV